MLPHTDGVKALKALVLLLANRKAKTANIVDVLCMDVPVSP